MKKTLCYLVLLLCLLTPVFGGELRLGTGGALNFGTSSYENWNDPYSIINMHFGITPSVGDIYNSAYTAYSLAISGIGALASASECFNSPLIGSASYRFSRLSGSSYSPVIHAGGLDTRSPSLATKLSFKVRRLPSYPDTGFGQVVFFNTGSTQYDRISLYLQRVNNGGVYSNTLHFAYGRFVYDASLTPQLDKWYTIRIWPSPSAAAYNAKFWHIEVPEADLHYTSPSTTDGTTGTKLTTINLCYEYTNTSTSDSFLAEVDEVYLAKPSIYSSIFTLPEPPSAPIEFQTPPGAKLNLGE